MSSQLFKVLTHGPVPCNSGAIPQETT
jgi:hypothetical protein